MAKAWWRKHTLRIYHPNARESELGDLDVPRFIADCLSTNAEAIVVNAGGVYAFYPSQVPYHYVSPAIGDRDLLGEIIAEAHAHDLRVIARVDFSRAREEVFQAHPGWFQRTPQGEAACAGAYYLTCPSGGYQNADLALPVLREILARYGVDGFHLNGAGFSGPCACSACTAAFGAPIPTGPEADPDAWVRFERWREQALAGQLAGYYHALHEVDADCFFMAELAGPESPAWAHAAAHHLPALARSFSRVLVTAGGLASARSSRWWVGVACEQAHAVRRKRSPIINLKMQMRDVGSSQALLPPAEFAFYAYQALAHGAGLKVATFGLPESQLDPRALPAVSEAFAFMRQQQEVLDSMVPIHDVALIWPEAGLRRAPAAGATGGLRGEFMGLYAALRARHVLTGVLYDEQLTAGRLHGFQAVILPTTAGLADEAVEALVSYVLEGGRLVLLDSPAASASAGFLPMPESLARVMGGAWSVEAGQAPYMLPVAQLLPLRPGEAPPAQKAAAFRPLPRALSGVIERAWARDGSVDRGDAPGPQPGRGIGPLRLTLPYRKVREAEGIQVWLRTATLREAALPEELGQLEGGEDPLVLVAPAGEGLIAYAATGLGAMCLDTGHEDYATILEAMISHGATVKPYLLTDAPSSVELTMAHWSLGVVVHLVNAAGPAPLDAPAPVGPITLDLAWDGPAVAHLCAPGSSPQALRCKEEWNRVQITVPRLDAYAQVVIRSG
jgi:hypothetical protein